MRYQQIKFKDLPFKPGHDQVFYIESEYDVSVNERIRSNYNEIRDAMQKHGMQFCYLPYLFHSADIERKIHYYAPYLSERIIADKSIGSGAMLRFLSDKSQKVEPSLIFYAVNSYAVEETTFMQLPISEVCKDDSFSIDDIIFNIECANEERVSVCLLDSMYIEEDSSQSGIRFCKDLGSEEELRTEEDLFSEELPVRASLKHYDTPDDIEEEKNAKETEEKRRSSKKRGIIERLMKCFTSAQSSSSIEDIIDADEDADKSFIDTQKILRELRENVQKLRLEGVSLMAIHEFIDKQEPLSRMTIKDDYRIFLPDYNNMEIEMGALPKAVYFLFLRYPEGIIYKHMPDYYNELMGIYKQLRPNTDEARLNLTITKVVNPLGNALNENIARIRKAFVDKFDEHLARNYYISGERGLQYSIPLDRNLINWEE